MGSAKLARVLALDQSLEDLLAECDPSEIPHYNWRYSRTWFAERIGCRPKVLSESLILKNRLSAWEERHRPDFSRQAVILDGSVNIVPLNRAKKDSIILQVEIEIGRELARHTIPTLIWNSGIDEWIADYARHCVITKHFAPSSILKTVIGLRQFRRYQRSKNVSDTGVCDAFLRDFQVSLAEKGIGVDRRNYLISTVHSFYMWAETRGFLLYHTQVKPVHEYTGLPEHYTFPISSEAIEVRLPRGGTYKKWVSKLLEDGSHSNFGRRRTPTPKQVEELYDKAELSGKYAARNLLMLQVAVETGARVSEIVQLKANDFPAPEDLGRFVGSNADDYLEVMVVRKNQAEGKLRFNKTLVPVLVAFIYNDAERQKAVAKWRLSSRENAEPLFFSERGSALNEDSVTRIAHGIFKDANVEAANIHRLRARFITEVIELLLDRMSEDGVTVNRSEAWENQVLAMAVELMGHSHTMSLKPYLNSILHRRLTVTGRILSRSVEEQERSIKRANDLVAKQVVRKAKLLEAERLMEAGDDFEAGAILLQYGAELQKGRDEAASLI